MKFVIGSGTTQGRVHVAIIARSEKCECTYIFYLSSTFFFSQSINLKCVLRTTSQWEMVPVPRIHVFESGRQITDINVVNSSQIGQN